MLGRAGFARLLAAGGPLWGVLVVLLAGCAHHANLPPEMLAERILPPPGAVAEEGHQTGELEKPAKSAPSTQDAPPQPLRIDHVPCAPLTLPEALALAFELQPRLKASLESIQQAQGREDIAFAAFLPTVTSAYSVGGFDLNVGGSGLPLPNSPPFTFIPFAGSLPVGLDIQPGYELAELKLEWLVCDFGRRLGRYNQAGLAVDIAQLQTERAYQTVANDVAVAYYQVLRARSLYRIAEESVHRASDDLDVAQKLAKGGVVEHEKVLRAQVGVAQAQRVLDTAEEAETIAIAALNLAIGFNVSAPTDVVDLPEMLPFTQDLTESLQTAVSSRREFQVARRSVQVAQEGSRAAHADFAPRIVAGGDLLDFQQAGPRGHADLALGFIKLEWGLFEGGKRVAELRMANSRIREAVAEADAIADTIAFQVNQAYRQLVAARKGIERSRPAVTQTQETYRLVLARERQGDAIPAEVTDAATALTRAEQDFANSVYDYLTARARLEYAMGVNADPATVGAGHSCRGN